MEKVHIVRKGKLYLYRNGFRKNRWTDRITDARLFEPGKTPDINGAKIEEHEVRTMYNVYWSSYWYAGGEPRFTVYPHKRVQGGDARYGEFESVEEGMNVRIAEQEKEVAKAKEVLDQMKAAKELYIVEKSLKED